jgi:hypothetical protein
MLLSIATRNAAEAALRNAPVPHRGMAHYPNDVSAIQAKAQIWLKSRSSVSA